MMDLVVTTWNTETYGQFMDYLNRCADEKYRAFHSRLVPTVEKLLGIRVPVMRSIAKEIARGDLDGFLSICSYDYYEETMIAGLAIGYSKDWDQTLKRLEKFVPKIDNWGVCDSVCAGLKLFDRYPEEGFRWLQQYETSEKEFEQRFLLVMLLFHYRKKPWLEQVLEIGLSIHPAGYYSMMGQAWLMAECCIDFPEQSDPCLERLSGEGYDKTIQKIRESRKVSLQRKAEYLHKKQSKKQKERN